VRPTHTSKLDLELVGYGDKSATLLGGARAAKLKKEIIDDR